MTVTKLLALDSNPSFETPFSVGGGSTIFSGQLVGRGTGSPQWKVSRSQVCIIWTKETKELVYPPHSSPSSVFSLDADKQADFQPGQNVLQPGLDTVLLEQSSLLPSSLPPRTWDFT